MCTVRVCRLKLSYASGLISHSSSLTLTATKSGNHVAWHRVDVLFVTSAAEQGLDGLATGEHSQVQSIKGQRLGCVLEEATMGKLICDIPGHKGVVDDNSDSFRAVQKAVADHLAAVPTGRVYGTLGQAGTKWHITPQGQDWHIGPA
jgi:hypothetical protein